MPGALFQTAACSQATVRAHTRELIKDVCFGMTILCKVRILGLVYLNDLQSQVL